MTTYWIDIKKCPECGCEFSAWELGSCNTFGAKFYTDGFVEGPMYDEDRLLVICPKCKRYFWREDVPTLESMPDMKFLMKYGANSSEKSFPKSGWVQGRHFEDMVRRSFWRTPDEQKYIRIRAWWAYNATYRDNPNKAFRLSAKQQSNLRRLLDLLHPDNPHDSIMKAELHRELGEFDECLKLLLKPFDGRFHRAIDTIKKLAHDRKRKPELVG